MPWTGVVSNVLLGHIDAASPDDPVRRHIVPRGIKTHRKLSTQNRRYLVDHHVVNDTIRAVSSFSAHDSHDMWP